MTTPLTTLKRLTLASALAATMSFGLLGGQSVGIALADDLPFPTDLPGQVLGPALGAGSEQTPTDPSQAASSAATDPSQTTQATQPTAPDSDVQAAGAIVESVLGR